MQQVPDRLRGVSGSVAASVTLLHTLSTYFVQVTLAEMREVLALRFGGDGIVRVRGIPPSEVGTLTAALPPAALHGIMPASPADRLRLL